MQSASPRMIEFVRRFMAEMVPFHRVLGVEVDHLEPGFAALSVPYRPELIGDPDRPALHGGVLSALADACGGAAVWTAVGDGDRVSTVDLRVDYLRPARLERVRAEARVARVGNRVAVTRIVLMHPESANPTESVAEAMGVYSVKRASDPPESR